MKVRIGGKERPQILTVKTTLGEEDAERLQT
jgi:hypothetical protein